MSKPKLSVAQVKVLRTMAEPGAKAHFMTGFAPYWFLSNRNGQVRFATMDKLISGGFLGTEKDTLGQYRTATITPAGLSYLAALEGKEDG